MKFEIGKTYTNGARTLTILVKVRTEIYGETYLAEDSEGNFSPVGMDSIATTGYREITPISNN